MDSPLPEEEGRFKLEGQAYQGLSPGSDLETLIPTPGYADYTDDGYSGEHLNFTGEQVVLYPFH